jgi:hypothetical protein
MVETSRVKTKRELWKRSEGKWRIKDMETESEPESGSSARCVTERMKVGSTLMCTSQGPEEAHYIYIYIFLGQPYLRVITIIKSDGVHQAHPLPRKREVSLCQSQFLIQELNRFGLGLAYTFTQLSQQVPGRIEGERERTDRSPKVGIGGS